VELHGRNTPGVFSNAPARGGAALYWSGR
jgi:hypothetical protein